MKTPKFLLPVATAGVLALTLSACGGGGGGTTAGADAEQGLDGRGPITYVQGKDNSNVVRPLIEKWNAAHPDEKVTFKEQTDQADQQHDDLVQNFQAKNANYDVVSVDVVWTAEFAAKGWLQPLKDKMALDTSAMLKPTVESASYKGTLYAAPQNSDGGILYYRKDLVPTAPKTWDEMMGMCSIAKENNIGCFAGQYAKYEGLTVNTSEAINSAGGSVLDAEGKPSLNTPEAKAGLENLAKAYADGSIPKEAITFQEEQGRQAFQDGKLLFHRNWPYVYNLATTEGSSKVKDVLGMTAAARHGRPRRIDPGRTQRRHERLLEEQGHRPGLPEVPHLRGNPEVLRHAGLPGPGARRALRRQGTRRQAAVPAGAEDLDRERRAASGHPVLPGRHQGHPGKRLLGHQGREDRGCGPVRHAEVHRVR